MSNWYSGNWLLPGLPSPPPLKQSVQMFLSSMKPCLSEEKYKQAEMMAEEFLKKEGPALHRKVRVKTMLSILRAWICQKSVPQKSVICLNCFKKPSFYMKLEAPTSRLDIELSVSYFTLLSFLQIERLTLLS